MNNLLMCTDKEEVVANLRIGELNDFDGEHVLITGGQGFLSRYFTEVFA
jgi:hypothetical protein